MKLWVELYWGEGRAVLPQHESKILVERLVRADSGKKCVWGSARTTRTERRGGEGGRGAGYPGQTCNGPYRQRLQLPGERNQIGFRLPRVEDELWRRQTYCCPRHTNARTERERERKNGDHASLICLSTPSLSLGGSSSNVLAPASDLLYKGQGTFLGGRGRTLKQTIKCRNGVGVFFKYLRCKVSP